MAAKNPTAASPKAAAPGERLELNLYEEINTWSVRSLVERLQAAPDAPVLLRVNSPGGDVQEGFALASALRTHRGHKTAVVEGVCASAATFPLCACDLVQMHPESLLMVHQPWGGAGGTADEIETYAEVLRKMESLMIGLYQRKTGADEATVRSWMQRGDHWMTPTEAKEAGFADAILTDAPAPSARASAARFAALLRLPIRPPTAAKNTRNTMEETLKDKLAKHGLAEDDSNLPEALAAYLAETEDGPKDRQATAKAAEEYMESRKAKAEDDKPEEESSTGDGKSKARIRQDAHADPAVAKLVEKLTARLETYEAKERKRAEAEFYASAELHVSRKEAEEYAALCDNDLAKALKLVQKLPRKQGALSRWYAGGSPIGGSSTPAADSYEATKVIHQGNKVVNLHGYGLRALAKKIQADKQCSLEQAYKAAARERPDLARASV